MAVSSAIHPNSSVVSLREFDLFVVPSTQTTVERDIASEHRPLAPIDSSTNSLLQFEIQTPEDEYLRLNDIELYLKLRIDITKFDDDNKVVDVKQEDWKSVSCINNLLHSMIKQIDVFVGTKQVYSTSSTYAYKAYLEKKLAFTPDAKTTLLTTALYTKDDYDKWDDIDVNRQKYFARKTTSKEKAAIGQYFELQDRLHFDLTWQSNLLLGGCKIKFNIQFNDSKFYLMAKDGVIPSVVVKDACLICHRAKVSPAIVLAHSAGLAQTPAKYPFVWGVVKEHTIPSGNHEGIWDNVVHGVQPRRIIVGLVSNATFNGSLTKNPLKFEHFNLSNIIVTVDGVQHPPGGYSLDVDNNTFVKALRGFYHAINQNDNDHTTDINRDNYLKGNTLFGFNFAPDLSNGVGQGGHANLIKYGSMQIKIKFKSALSEAVTVLVYCEYDKILEIPLDREGAIVIN